MAAGVGCRGRGREEVAAGLLREVRTGQPAGRAAAADTGEGCARGRAVVRLGPSPLFLSLFSLVAVGTRAGGGVPLYLPLGRGRSSSRRRARRARPMPSGGAARRRP